jgi:hypothetical protein
MVGSGKQQDREKSYDSMFKIFYLFNINNSFFLEINAAANSLFFLTIK